MRIKSIELIGFKSFYNKTKLELSNGINAVVGPNGCGKSNIIDAMRWVLGEQNPRMLRAEGMEELIANGTDVLKPLGMAEVTLVVENLPGIGFEEVSIKRRYYRSGESEYSINGVKCRLKDIAELFLDTGAGARGYSIIGQGKVEEFITAKPEEKRRLIEEVAGVLKYKTRRKETQSRIEATRENLSRVSDMIKEVSRQMESLSRQAGEAEEYKKLTEHLKLLELNIFQFRLNKLTIENSNLETEKSRLGISIKELTEKREQGNQALRDSESANSKFNEEINRFDNEIYTIKTKINEKNSYREYVTKESAGIDEYINRLKKETGSIESEKNEIRETVANKRNYLQRNEIEKNSIQSELQTLENNLDNLRQESTNNKNELEKTKSILFEILNNYSTIKGSAVGIGKELEELKSRRVRLEAELENQSVNINKSNERLVRLNNEIEQLQNEKGSFQQNKDTLVNTYISNKQMFEKGVEENNGLREKLNDALSKIEVLNDIQSSYEWLPEAVREFLVENKIDGVLGVVSDFVQVPENYEKALEAALGEKSNWVVVRDSHDALTAIDLLKGSSSGRGTFFPLANKDYPKPAVSENAGYKKISDLVNVKEIDKQFIDSILESIYVVSCLDEAIKLRDELGSGVSAVTMEGSFVDRYGAISGGFTTGGVFERKREIEVLETISADLQKKVSTNKTKLDTLSSEIQRNNSEIENLDRVLREKELKAVEIDRDISNLKLTIKEYIERRDSIESETRAVDEQISSKNIQVEEFSNKLSNLENEKEELDQRFTQFEDIVKNYETREKLIEQDITGFKVKSAAIIETERLVEREINELLERDTRLSDKIISEKEEINSKEKEKEELLGNGQATIEQVETLGQQLLFKEKELNELKSKRDKSAESLIDSRRAVENIDQDLIGLKDDSSSIEIKINGVALEISHINEQVQKITGEEEIKPGDADDRSNFNLNESTREYNKLKKRVDSFGLVNLLAPEEYKKLEERYNFLTEQTEDLENALESLVKAINKLDRESITRFKEAFDLINNRFQEIISKLFAGGEGKLVITDPDDLLNTGIEVMVRPGGKKMQSINLLSGGEKALSAIALIISACFVKPVPFLLLDEIDAPLDETNTARFAKLVREISKDSQVVIITHNKSTMMDVDTLVGITAGKSVASKVVSVELNAA